jgi:hypothetical protein
VRREGSDYIVEASLPQRPTGAGTSAGAGVACGGGPGGAAGWTQLRMAHLLEDPGPAPRALQATGGISPAVAAGLYACSPTGPGFTAVFRHLTCWAGRLAEAE